MGRAGGRADPPAEEGPVAWILLIELPVKDVEEDPMDSDQFSIIAWCSHVPQTEITQLQLVRVDTGKEVHLNEGIFLLRIYTEEDGAVMRCHIRHITSGSEAYMQGGSNLRAFIKAYLLKDNELTP